jgi:hypothetical protein
LVWEFEGETPGVGSSTIGGVCLVVGAGTCLSLHLNLKVINLYYIYIYIYICVCVCLVVGNVKQRNE